MRLIDADATIEFLAGFGNREYRSEKGTIREAIKALKYAEYTPTVDAEPVRHGHWIYNKDTGEIKCNLCNALVGMTMCPDDVELITEVENFCFNCGAKMGGVSE